MTKRLSEEDLRLITALVEHRERLRSEIKELTNVKIAEKFGYHKNTIDKYAASVTKGNRS